MHILLIEDDKNFGLILKLELEADQHRVDLAHDGVEGVLSFIQNRYDFVLVDIRLPRLTGTDALRIMHGIDPSVQALAFTGSAGRQEMQDVREAGASACLSKPFTMSRLKLELESIH